MKLKTLFKSQASSDDQWIATADIMATLMLIFAMLAIFIMAKINRDIADDINIVQNDIYSALILEFRDDERKKWGVEIDESNGTVTFSGSVVQFKNNSAEITDKFKNILNNFFPRYIEAIRDFRNDIHEIDIEGHTNSKSKKVNEEEGYSYNMHLSQRRAFNVLKYCRKTLSKRSGLRNAISFNNLDKDWTKKVLRAVGYSYSKPVCKNGKIECTHEHEDFEASRRVQFRIRIEDNVLIEQIRDIKKKAIETSY